MKESIETALSFVKARAPSYGIKPSLFQRKDIHIHLPEGAVPKDGPSAGIGMVTSIVSTLTGVPVRREIAMTGEVTLRGRVLPIGGLKEKLLAALRGGIKTVLIPQENEKDLAEIPANIQRRADDHPGRACRRGAAARADRAARGDRLDRGRRAGGAAAGADRARRANCTIDQQPKRSAANSPTGLDLRRNRFDSSRGQSPYCADSPRAASLITDVNSKRGFRVR